MRFIRSIGFDEFMLALFVLFAGAGIYWATRPSPVGATAPKTRMGCDDGYVLTSEVYRNPNWLCVPGRMPKDVPVQ